MGTKSNYPLSLLVVTVVICGTVCSSYMIGKNPHHRAEYLDSHGMYYLEWKVDWSGEMIIFNLTVATTGYVLFGLTNNSSATSTSGADIIITGVRPNTEEAYFSDRYMLGNEVPREDSTEADDYVLYGAWENKTHTIISFSRALDTCDPFDYPITDNRVTVIWGYGVTDNYEAVRNYGVQGTFDVHLLDSEYSPRIVRDRRLNGAPTVVTKDNLELWTVRRQIVLPNNATTYICSIHKAPRLQMKHHVVGFDVYFHNIGSRNRTRHLLIYKCHAPGGRDPRPLFEPFEGGQGRTCHWTTLPSFPVPDSMPTYFCSELWMEWASGGRSFFTPPHVGIPFGRQADEYYMVQVRYENPELTPGIVVDMRLDFFYTSLLRPNDGGILGTGLEIAALPESMVVPPKTDKHRIFHHCSGECVRKMLPPTGIIVYAAQLHSHRSAKMLRLRHFTGPSLSKESAWIKFDDNFSSDFQQTRHLKEEIKVLPGDQLTVECTYGNPWTNSSVGGGFSTSQGVCLSFIHYYNRINDYSYCSSEINSEEYRRRFLGVSNITWDENRLQWVSVTPPIFVNWDAERRQMLTRFHEAHPHVTRCSRNLAYRNPEQLQELLRNWRMGARTFSLNTPDDYIAPGEYPFKAQPYIAKQSCSYTSKRGVDNNSR